MAFLGKVRGLLQHKITNNVGREVSASTPFLFQAIRCMSSKIFVGGLSYQTSEDTLRQTFEKYGQVYEARIILDRETGNSRGFGFVTFENSEAARSAIMALDGQDLDGRRLKVSHAHDRGPGFGGGRSYNNAGGNFGGGGAYNNYGGGGNYQGGGGYSNYGGGGGGGGGSGGGGGNYQGGGSYGNYQDGGSYQGGGGGFNYGGGGNYQGDQVNLSNNPGYGTTGGGSYDSNYVGGNVPYSGGNLDSSGNFSSANAGYAGANDQSFGVPPASDNYNVDGSNVGSNFSSAPYENTTTGFNHEVNSDSGFENEPDEYQARRAS
ncbi:OLC1v1012111C2 [Oldenlandia corymbosa var. corymbosa]|uniref:OLC1v1012111C2 n=1 Tax=Oldenlandia corymbosa var. corymbosa TaxID=529605 RepID=A0AAV1DVB8_OLDCO|nr:OLC1v1012111C2 [Oldenlandia corymbosa var. corymbosa]